MTSEPDGADDVAGRSDEDNRELQEQQERVRLVDELKANLRQIEQADIAYGAELVEIAYPAQLEQLLPDERDATELGLGGARHTSAAKMDSAVARLLNGSNDLG